MWLPVPTLKVYSGVLVKLPMKGEICSSAATANMTPDQTYNAHVPALPSAPE